MQNAFQIDNPLFFEPGKRDFIKKYIQTLRFLVQQEFKQQWRTAAGLARWKCDNQREIAGT